MNKTSITLTITFGDAQPAVSVHLDGADAAPLRLLPPSSRRSLRFGLSPALALRECAELAAALSVPAGDLEAQTLPDLLPETDRMTLLTQVGALAAGQEVALPQTSLQAPGGVPLPCDLKLSANYAEGRFAGATVEAMLAAATQPAHPPAAEPEQAHLADRVHQLQIQLQKTIAHAPLGVALLNDDGRFLLANDALLDLLRTESFSLKDRFFSDLLPMDRRSEWASWLSHPRPTTGEFPIAGVGCNLTLLPFHEGQARWLVYILPLRTPAETGHTLTEAFRQQADALAAAQMEIRRLQALVDGQAAAISQAFAVAEYDVSGRLMGVNQTFLQLLDAERYDVLGCAYTEFLHEAGAPLDWQTLLDGEMMTGERPIRRFDGGVAWVQTTFAAIRDAEGQPCAVLQLAAETPDRQAVWEAQRYEEAWRMMLDGAPVGMCITNEHGLFEWVNQAYANLYGYEPAELAGLHFGILTADETPRAIDPTSGLEVFTARTSNGAPLTVLAQTTRLEGPDGAEKYITFVLPAGVGDIPAGDWFEALMTTTHTAKTSARHVERILPEVFGGLPHLIARLSPGMVALFQALMNRAATATVVLSEAEEEQVRRRLTDILTVNDAPDAEALAAVLVEIRVMDGVEAFLPLFRHERRDEMLQLVYLVGQAKAYLRNIALSADESVQLLGVMDAPEATA